MFKTLFYLLVGQVNTEHLKLNTCLAAICYNCDVKMMIYFRIVNTVAFTVGQYL